MSLASIPDMEDDTQEYPTTNAIRICNDSIPSYHSCKNLPIINSFSEIREDFSFVRINSLDRIRMNFKSKLTIALPFDGINKTETENKEFNRNSDASMEELLPTDELTVSPNLQQFVSVVRQYNLIPASSYQRKEHMELLKNVGELIRNAMVQDGVLLPYCETIHFTFGGFWEIFEKQGTLGQGCAGVVSKCCRKSNPTEEYAVKVVNTNGDEELMLKTVQEYKNYRKLFHRNIVNVYELHIDLTNKKTYMLMELVKGRELQSHLASRTRFDEKTASHIMRELMSGIQYLHSRGVVHRDIKPENIMISEDYEIVKIADLNVSKFFENKHYLYFPDRKNNFQMWTYTGTPAFLPPEVFIDLEYSEGIDVWGAGVVLYTMLSGKLPFKSEYQEDLINKIKLAEVKFHGLIWHTISNEAKDLVLKLLHKDSNIRSSPTEALTHPWLLHKTKKALYNNSPMLSIKNELLSSKNTTPKLLQFLEQFLVPKKTMTL